MPRLGTEVNTAPLQLGRTGILATKANGTEMIPTKPATTAITTIGWSVVCMREAYQSFGSNLQSIAVRMVRLYFRLVDVSTKVWLGFAALADLTGKMGCRFCIR